jgi:RNA polymerase sigma-70 factor, ECF subfamily
MKQSEVLHFTASRSGESSRSRENQLKAVFDELFEQYWSPITLVLVRLLGDADEAEDLALETFCRLNQELERLRPGDNLGGWLYRVAVNLGLNALRSEQRRKVYENDAGLEAVRSAAFPNPAQETEAREEKRQVRLVLAEMKPHSAQLLFLRSAGLSYQELAEICQVPVRSMGTTLRRAEQEFEKRYRARFGEGK